MKIQILVFMSEIKLATSENRGFGVHELNKIRSYTEKKKSIFLFLLCFYLQ